MKKALIVGIGLMTVILAMRVSAQSLPQGSVLPGDKLLPSGTSQNIGQKAKTLPGDQTIPSYEIDDPDLKAAMEKSRKTLATMRGQQKEPVAQSDLQPPLEPVALVPLAHAEAPEVVQPVSWSESVSAPAELTKAVGKQQNHKSNVGGIAEGTSFNDTKGGVRIFSQGLNAARSAAKESFTLPATSIALATTLYGIEATGNVERLLPAELNYAWLGPNGTVVEMKDCRIWIAVRGDYSTERIYGRSQSMSCRAPTGETFDIAIEAQMVDQKEEYLGARGTLVARGKALASALSFLSDGVKAFGSAMASAQVNTEVAAGGATGGAVKGSNVAGDQNKYMLGQTLSGSSAKFLDWWIDYYQSLSPTIAIGPGKKIYLALQRTVQIPKIFFGEQLSYRQGVAISSGQQGDAIDPGHTTTKVNTSYALKSSSGALSGEGMNSAGNNEEDRQ